MKESKFKIQKTQLLSLDFEVNENYFEEDISLDIGTEIQIMNSMKGENQARVVLTLNIFEKKDFEKAPFFIKLKMAGEFSWSDDIDKELLETLLKNNAPAILLSYSRPFVSQLTSYSGFPPLILPLLDFTTTE